MNYSHNNKNNQAINIDYYINRSGSVALIERPRAKVSWAFFMQ
jgi:hypothetical protein